MKAGHASSMVELEMSLLNSGEGLTTTSQTAPLLEIEHIEDRGVSASFLQHIAAKLLANAALRRQATDAACAFLTQQIAETEHDIAGIKSGAQHKSAVQALVPTARSGATGQNACTVPQLALDQLEPEPESAPQPTLPSPVARYMVARQQSRAVALERQLTGRTICNQMQLRKLERDLVQYRKDLAKRKAKPYLTLRDVHKLMVVPMTKQKMCRFVELSEMRGEDDAGRSYVGTADYFFSYSWDSPWEAVVDALVAHTEQQQAAGSCPPYYWIDIFAVNQHTSLPPWECQSGMTNCPGCAAVASDMPDWDQMRKLQQQNKLAGFERVIEHTKHTLVLNEPWDCPRPPARVWCLFEGYMTLQKHGHLEVVLGPRQELDLQLSLAAKFGELEAQVSSIDATLANATVKKDQEQIFRAIEQLPRGFDGLNYQMQLSQRRQLAAAARKGLQRADPRRPPMDIAPAEELIWVRLLERKPWIPVVLSTLGWSTAVVALAMAVCGELVYVQWIGVADGWSVQDFETTPHYILNFCSGLFLAAILLVGAGYILERQQRARLLRTASPLGAWVMRRSRTLIFALCLLTQVSFTLGLAHAMHTTLRPPDPEREYQPWALALYCAMFPTFGAGLLSMRLVKRVEQTALQRVELAVQVGWLQIAIGQGQSEERETVTRDALAVFEQAQIEVQSIMGREQPQCSYAATPGLVRCLCELGRHTEAQAIRAIMNKSLDSCCCSIAPRCSWSVFIDNRTAVTMIKVLALGAVMAHVTMVMMTCWCGIPILNPLVGHTFGDPISLVEASRCMVTVIVAARSAATVTMLMPIALAISLTLHLIDDFLRSLSCTTMLRARVAAGMRCPDEEVLTLFIQVGKTRWGKQQVLNKTMPELSEFLDRMADESGDPVDRAVWKELPPLMRSTGDNPLSAWVKYTCRGHCYYKRSDPEIATLDLPAAGVRQEAEIGMAGLQMLGETVVESRLPGFSQECRWQSEYADLGGPGCWSEQRNRQHKFRLQVTKAAYVLLCLVTTIALFCTAFVYIDCNGHGKWGIGRCVCIDGYRGARCDVPPLPAAPAFMPDAYVLSGAVNNLLNGRYQRLAAQCSGKPVYYQAGGSTILLLYQPLNTSSWSINGVYSLSGILGTRNTPSLCENTGAYITSYGNGGFCPQRPDSEGCAGRWREFNGRHWHAAPSIKVKRWCSLQNPCCGIDCGLHGKLDHATCTCACSANYHGDYCEMPPLPLGGGLVEAYIVMGGEDYVPVLGTYNGRYERISKQCNGKPVYQQVSPPGWVLFQPSDGTRDWVVSTMDFAATCDRTAMITSNTDGMGGACSASPDGAGCNGTWMVYTEDCDTDAGRHGCVNYPCRWCRVPPLMILPA